MPLHQPLNLAPVALVGTAIQAPWGPMHLAASELGVVAVELMAGESDFRTGIERRFRRPMLWLATRNVDAEPVAEPVAEAGAAKAHLWSAAEALLAAIGGDDADLSSLSLDLSDRPAWDRAVLGAVRAIPRGETRSYADIARAIGRAGAARAVGGAVGRNPIGFVIPCHRVIAADGTLGGYGGGWWGERDRLLELKEDLLAGEGIRVCRRRSGLAPAR